MTLTGTIETIRIQKTDSGWGVATLKTPNGTAVITGVMPPLRIGMTCQVTGEPFTNRYGQQFKVDSFMETRPSDEEGIYKYLSSGLVANIGPVYARKIVDAFGERTFEVLDNEPERLRDIRGIGAKRAQSIIDSFKEQREISAIMVWLKRYDLTNSLAARIYQTYGNKSLAVLENNPYVLADDIKGIAFKRADDAAKKMGIPEDSAFRIRSGILALLQDRAAQGHTCTPIDKTVRTASGPDYLNVQPSLVEQQLLNPEFAGRRVIIDDERTYLPMYYNAEKGIARKIRLIQSENTSLDTPDLDRIRRETGMNYSGEQESAILSAAWESLVILTGGPGTGKTATTNAIIRMLATAGLSFVLAAPTGRAAKRMSEVTGHMASTIHRLLEYSGGGFQKDEDNPIHADAVIIDESSMIDTLLMYSLLKAVRPGTKLILVGDVDQLPSVGAGSVLRDIIDSGRVTTVRLTQIFRQAQDSDIVVNAHRINRGGMPVLKEPGKQKDFVFLSEEDKETVADLVVNTVRHLIDIGYDKESIQVLSPMRRDWDPIGSTALNMRLQDLLNHDGKAVAKKEGTEFRVGDRIMQVKNNYDKDLFNGDVGYITHALSGNDPDKAVFEADFEGTPQRFAPADVAEIELAYACTVHKSQGSEYTVVVMPVHNSHFIMLKRNLLYTGITRAKHVCCIIGTEEAIRNAVRREDTERRDTTLALRLAQTPREEFRETLF